MSIPNLGTQWTGDSHYSPPRVNAHGWFTGTGDEIAAIPNTLQIPAALCIETGSGFIKDVAYYSQYNEDMVRTGWLPFNPKHLHDSNSDAAGGLLSSIMNANMGKFLWIMLNLAKASDFTINKTGTNATIVNEAVTSGERVVITTGTPAANDLVTGTKAAIGESWASPIYMQIVSELDVAETELHRQGIGVERLDEGTDDTPKMGLELCSLTSANYQIVTADGNTSSRTLVTTTTPGDTGTPTSYKLILDPGVNVKLYVSGVLNTTKSNNIPASGTAARNRAFRAGIKTTNTTEKKLFVTAVAIYYVPGSLWF